MPSKDSRKRRKHREEQRGLLPDHLRMNTPHNNTKIYTRPARTCVLLDGEILDRIHAFAAQNGLSRNLAINVLLGQGLLTDEPQQHTLAEVDQFEDLTNQQKDALIRGGF